MRWYNQLTCVLGLACLAGGCSGGDKDGRAAEAEKPVPASALVDTVAADISPSSEPVASAEPLPIAASAAEPATPPAAEDELAGQVVAVPATKPGLTLVGAAKCKTCHKVQYESWAISAHAERTPPLGCEGCHGPGSEYKKLATMKDPALAKAAGLVMPAKTFCTTTCHRSNWQDDMLAKSHAHKDKAP
jgi:hypothetical protein